MWKVPPRLLPKPKIWPRQQLKSATYVSRGRETQLDSHPDLSIVGHRGPSSQTVKRRPVDIGLTGPTVQISPLFERHRVSVP